MIFLIAVVMLGLIIFVHELGHFLTAKFFGIPVSEFSIGMGPQVCSLETKKTTYSFRAIPMGGYVNIEGMEVGSEVEDGFNTKPAYQRIIVLAAGVMMNFLTAFLVLVVAFKLSGKMEYTKTPVIGMIAKESINNKLLQKSDKILEIEGREIKTWEDISKNINLLDTNKEIKEKDVKIKIERNKEEQELVLKLERNKNNKKLMLGVSPTFNKKSLSFSESLVYSAGTFKNMFVGTLNGFIVLFTGKADLKEITGPVGIFKVVGEMAKFGWFSVLSLAAIISVNIGMLNLLPIPALDGGRIIFVLLELVGIKINKTWEERIHKIGMMFLMILIISISANDIFKIFN